MIGGDYTFNFELLEDPALLAQPWQNLAAEANVSFFNSWPWVKTWLEQQHRLGKVYLLRAQSKGALAALALFGARRVWHCRCLPAQSLWLQASGSADLDAVRVEHNSWLLRNGKDSELAAAMWDWLADHFERHS